MAHWLSDWIYSKTGVALVPADISFDYEAQTLAATALAAAASADDDHSPAEAQEIMEILTSQYRHAGASAFDVLTRAVLGVAEQRDVGSLFAEIRNRLPLPAREELLASLAQIVAADGRRTPAEWRFIAKAAEELEIPEDLFAKAIATARSRR